MTTTRVTRSDSDDEQRVEITVDGTDAFAEAKTVMREEFDDFPTDAATSVTVELVAPADADPTDASADSADSADWACPECDATFPTKSQLNGHRAAHTDASADDSDDDREYDTLSPDTVRHEVLSLIAKLGEADYEDLRDNIQTGATNTATTAASKLWYGRLVDRERKPGSRRYYYHLSDHGKNELSRVGSHPVVDFDVTRLDDSQLSLSDSRLEETA